MNDNKFLNQIGNLIDNKLQPLKKDMNGVKKYLTGVKKDVATVKQNLSGVKKQLNTVELKVELVNKRVTEGHQELKQSIKQSQEDTISVLSDLIHTGYSLHEKRIKKIEDTLQITNPQ